MFSGAWLNIKFFCFVLFSDSELATLLNICQPLLHAKTSGKRPENCCKVPRALRVAFNRQETGGVGGTKRSEWVCGSNTGTLAVCQRFELSSWVLTTLHVTERIARWGGVYLGAQKFIRLQIKLYFMLLQLKSPFTENKPFADNWP